MKRFPDWQNRLNAYLVATAKEPFKPGSMDCALFTAGAVKAMTGTDLADAFQGQYRSLKAGFKALSTAGYASLSDFLEAHFVRVPMSFAQVGDIAFMDVEGQDALGIVQGEWIYIRSADGLANLPLTAASGAFRV